METVAGPRQIEPGTKLDDKYRIEQLLAVGGMGAVYLGTHIALRKRVAIKVLNPQVSSAGMVERFRREAITASQIGHEGIAQVTDFGTSLQGEPFLVMEYLEGESLAARLATSGRLPIQVACELGCAILAPLAAAHEAGIVHRDLKPDNVFLVRQSRGEAVKLLDFGISRAPGLEGEFRLTKTGLVLGTPYYMSPEQARGENEVGTAADLYAFGVILYEMLVGRVPIDGENYNQLMFHVLTGEFARPRAERPEIPEELERIILQAMALDPAKRPGSAMEIEQRLLAFCRPTFRNHQIERISSSSGLSFHALTGSQLPHGDPTDPELPSLPRDAAAVGRAAIGRAATEADPASVATPIPTPVTAPIAATAAESNLEISQIPEALPPEPPPRRRGLWIAGAAVLVCGGVAGVLMAASRRGDEGPPAPSENRTTSAEVRTAPSGSAAQAGSGAEDRASATVPTGKVAAGSPVDQDGPPSDKQAPPPGEAAAPEITLRFQIEPAGAVVELDGAVVRFPGAAGKTRQLTVRRDGAVHRLKISAPGYITREDEVRFDETQKLIVTLKRAGRGVPAGRSPKEQRPPKIEDVSPYGP